MKPQLASPADLRPGQGSPRILGALPSRRAILKTAAAIPAMLAPALSMAGMPSDFWNVPRTVWLRRPATGEEIRATYFADGALIEPEYQRVCWFLRDTHQGQAMYMSTVLLDILYAQGGWLRYFGLDRAAVTTSGARFPSTNAATEGAAFNSKHQSGGAHDGYVPGISLESQQRLGTWLAGGGVGYYPSKNFCHLDDGRIRYWRG